MECRLPARDRVDRFDGEDRLDHGGFERELGLSRLQRVLNGLSDAIDRVDVDQSSFLEEVRSHQRVRSLLMQSQLRS